MDARAFPRPAELIGAASGLGAPDARCARAPRRLLAGGMLERLSMRGASLRWRTTLHPRRRIGESHYSAIARFCVRLAREVAAVVGTGGFPVVLGGDHSCAIGTWSGVARAVSPLGPVGLVWIDAHMDGHTPATSRTGMAHGMPLAALLGQISALTPISPAGTGGGGTLSVRHLCLVGVRSHEPEEAELLAALGVRIFPMAEIDDRGLDTVLDEAIRIAGTGAAGFGISLDVDAIDPGDAPGVSTPAPGGIAAAALLEALRRHAGDPNLLAFELAEYNPCLDRHEKTAALVESVLAAITRADAESTRSPQELERCYGAHNYDTLPVVLMRGRGVHLWDANGRRYLDLMSAYSAVSLGHCHPRLVAAMHRQARTLAVTSRAYFNTCLPVLLERLCRLTGQDQALPVNTGLEAVETALKAARRWAHKVKGVAADRAEIIACEGNFHGRSIAIVGMSSEPKYRDGFGPFPRGFKLVPFGDAAALESAITPCTAAFLVEPVQGEGGIIVPPRGYLAECQRICRRHNVLLIADEVQTGLGRTGRLLACDHEDVKPDGLILGKALGGGLLPVSAFLGRRDVMAVFEPGIHGSTFGGNPLAAAVALETLDVLLQEHLVERSAHLGEILLDGLRQIDSPVVREVRGMGLFAAIEIDPAWGRANELVMRMIARGLLTKDTHETVVRIAPPLVISLSQLRWALKNIRLAIDDMERGFKKAA
ncbi:MAG: ornithine--oxo-acid transaminase [Betaproteobacteria bacterium]|nr:ornithine--oxo-acid transaminase [Betaproteobacteria bacterium]